MLAGERVVDGQELYARLFLAGDARVEACDEAAPLIMPLIGFSKETNSTRAGFARSTWR